MGIEPCWQTDHHTICIRYLLSYQMLHIYLWLKTFFLFYNIVMYLLYITMLLRIQDTGQQDKSAPINHNYVR